MTSLQDAPQLGRQIIQAPQFNFYIFLKKEYSNSLKNLSQNSTTTLQESLHYLRPTFSPSHSAISSSHAGLKRKMHQVGTMCHRLFDFYPNQGRNTNISVIIFSTLLILLHNPVSIASGDGRGGREGRCNLPQFDLIQLCQIALAAAAMEGGNEKGTAT